MKTLSTLLLLTLLIGCDPQPVFPSVDLTSGEHPAKLLQQAEYYYAMVKQSKHGDDMELCIKAGTAMAAAALAEDQQAYLKWKATSEQDCKKAGL